MTDIYSAPESDLSIPREVGEYGSIERAIEGDYEFTIGDILREAWSKVKGCKWTFQKAFFIYSLVYIVVMFSVAAALGMGTGEMNVLAIVAQNIILIAVTTPLTAGLFMMGVKRSMGAPLSAGLIVGYYGKIVPLLVTTVLMYLMIVIGFLLLILPGIYLAIAYYMAIPLVVEKGLGPWEALEISRKSVGKRWFAILGLFIILVLINTLAVLTLGIGLVWTLPMSVIAYGLLYRNMFGVDPESLRD